MPLGYILTYHDVIDYYSREDIQRGLLSHGGRRRVVSGLDTGIFGRKGGPLARREQIREMLMPLLEKQISAVPRKYPSYHACITRASRKDRREMPEREDYGSDEEGSDLIIDIDIKTDHKQSWAQGRKVLDLLESFNVPYRVKFSGNSSPHIVLSADLFPPGTNGRNFNSTAQKVFDFIGRKSKATNMDGSFNSPDHYLRMPYSLHENTGLVSVPLHPHEYDSFRVEMAEAQNVVVREDWLDVSGEATEGMEEFLAAAGVRR